MNQHVPSPQSGAAPLAQRPAAVAVAEHLAMSAGRWAEPEPLPRPASLRGPMLAALAGRFALISALVLVLLAARQIAETQGRERSEAIVDFWPTVAFALSLGGLGLVSMAWFASTVATNAVRLRTKSRVRPATAALSWVAPLLWVAVCSVTILQLDVQAEIDPMPAIAALGLCVVMLVPYGRLQVALDSFDGRAPKVWLLYAFDLFVVGVVWWRLEDWSRRRGERATQAEEMVAYLGVAASAAILALVVTVWVAARVPRAISSRLHLIERRLGGVEAVPDWWSNGGAPMLTRSSENDDANGEAVSSGRSFAPWRPLLLIGYGVWAATVVALLVVAVDVWYERRDSFVRGSDLDRVLEAAGWVVVASAAAYALQACWALWVARRARRLTVYAPPVGQMALLYLGGPALGLLGLALRDTFGQWLVIAAGVASVVLFFISFRLLETVAVEIGVPSASLRAWMVSLLLLQPLEAVTRLVPPVSNDDAVMRIIGVALFGSILIGVATAFAARSSALLGARLRVARPAPRREPDLSIPTLEATA